jgi:hypothetical protein
MSSASQQPVVVRPQVERLVGEFSDLGGSQPFYRKVRTKGMGITPPVSLSAFCLTS